MLSYRHAFHAGNHADMLKHYVLFEVIQYFLRKDKPFWYIDTHAGAGLYDVSSEKAQKLGEYRLGVGRLQNADLKQVSLQQFRDYLQQFHHDETPIYAGSPWWAQSLLRESDRLRLYELHPGDFEILQQNMKRAKFARHCRLFRDDGFGGLLATLPPPTRRALVLMDPSYENKFDYLRVVETLAAAMRKFPQGCYLVWYPCLSKEASYKLPAALKALSPQQFLRAELYVKAPAEDGFGMHGSGMLVLNPPYVLGDILKETLPEITQILAQDSTAHYVLDYQIS